MIERLRITVLADNYVAARNLLGEHGLSLLIETDGRRILFDTGQGRVLRRNSDALGADSSHIEAVVISHGHHDHTGGLAELLGRCSPRAIYLHPAAVRPKYARSGNVPHPFTGIPEPSRQALDGLQDRVVWAESPAEVVPGVLVYGRNSPAARERAGGIRVCPGPRSL